MSCTIHDRCTCYGASLQHTACMATTTSTDSSQFAPQTNNIFIGHEWAAPLFTTSAAWYPPESVVIQPPTSHAGLDMLQSECHPIHMFQTYQESRVHERELKQAPSFCDQFAGQRPYLTPYISGVSQIPMPSTYPESWGPLLQTRRSGTAGFANYDGLLQIGSANQSTRFDEPPPPYPDSCLLVSPLGDVFTQSALLPTERHLDDGLIAASPLAPVPLRHSSLYQLLKHDSPNALGQGTLLHSGVSSIAHALEPQELQARPAPPAPTPANVTGNARCPTLGAPEPASSARVGQATPTSSLALAVVTAATMADPKTLPQIPTSPPSAQAEAQIFSATSPRAAVPAQNEAVVMPPQAHTLAQSLPEVAAIQGHDTLPRLRNPAPPGSAKEDQSSPLSPLSSRLSSSTGAPALSSRESMRALRSSFTLPIAGRKRPVLRTKLACLFCRRRKIQCQPSPGDHKDNTCQQCVKRSRQCEYPEMSCRRKRSRSELGDSNDEEEELEDEEDTPVRSKTKRDT